MPQVAEKPVITSEFVMPAISIGSIVLWHPDGDRNMAPSCGRVVHVSNRSVELITDTRDGVRYARDVHHIDDPRIRQNENIKSYGAWEYHPDSIRLMDLERRVHSLEKLVSK